MPKVKQSTTIFTKFGVYFGIGVPHSTPDYYGKQKTQHQKYSSRLILRLRRNKLWL